MEKIPTLFLRDPGNMSRVTREVDPAAAWVLAGEGTPTVKRDGTNVRVVVRDGRLRQVWKRRNPTREEKAAGAEPGYVGCLADDPGNKHTLAAVAATDFVVWPDGEWPCEALGPKIQGGVEGGGPRLYPFSWAPERLPDCERTFDGIRALLERLPVEGVVWHHPDGRMAKLKRRDFGFPWPVKI
jgi:hypothetical protein